MSFVYKNNPLPSGKYTVTSNYGWRYFDGKNEFHEGIDLGAAANTPIYAVADGVVTISKYGTGYGNYVEIDHGDAVRTRYAHMISPSHLSVGDKVAAKDVIGYVGSTGRSTGNHLHFEIRMNGNTQDPKPFMDAGYSIIASPEDYAYRSNTDNISSTISVPATGALSLGERVSALSAQPLHAYVNIRTGDNQEILSTKPSRSTIITSFEYTRMQEAGEEVTFSVFDDDWQEIEKKLAANWDNITFEYGYHGTGLKSKIIKMRLLSYNLSFDTTGTHISVQAVTEGALKNLQQSDMALETYNPTVAVKKICTNLGFVVKDENFDESQDITDSIDENGDGVVDPFNMTAEYPLSYILQVIVPQAAKENEELFSFWVDSENVAYFKRDDHANIKTDNIRTYIYQKGYDNPVKSFDVDIKGVFGGTSAGSDAFTVVTEYRSSVFDTGDKSSTSTTQTKSSVVTGATGDTTHTKSDQSSAIVDSAGYSERQMKSRLYYQMKANRFDAYKATMQIVGDPTIELFSYIRVINVTDTGYLHHTSGIYWIEEIIDSVDSDGTMTTTLKLLRNAVKGDIDGLEIINPKYEIETNER